MHAIPFDTLKMARKLEAAGFPGTQAAGAAEALAEAMTGAELANKGDLERETGLVRNDLARETGVLRNDMAREFGLVRIDLERVRTEVELLRRDMTIRLGAMMVVSTGILLTAMRFVPMHP